MSGDVCGGAERPHCRGTRQERIEKENCVGVGATKARAASLRRGQNTVRAMRLERPGPVAGLPLRLVEVPDPTAGTGEIRLRVGVCGICHTDLHIVEGELDLPRLPLIPGHQIVGIVDQVGEEVTRFRAGERAGVAWLHDACGQCDFCRSGRENLCSHARFTGLHVDGGYAEYVTIPADFAYAVPERYSDEHAAPLLCAGIIGYRALRLCRIQPGGRLGLYGFGASAHIALQIARHWGCEVYVFSRNPEHRDLATRLGAAWVGPPQENAPVALQSSILFAPAGNLVPRALESLERGGTLALAGIYMSPIPGLDYDKHLYHERSVTSVANSTRQDGEELMALARSFHIETHTEVFPLKDANEALRRLKESRIEASAVLTIGG